MLGILLFSMDFTDLCSSIFQCLVWLIALRIALHKERDSMRSLKMTDNMHLHENSAMSLLSVQIIGLM